MHAHTTKSDMESAEGIAYMLCFVVRVCGDCVCDAERVRACECAWVLATLGAYKQNHTHFTFWRRIWAPIELRFLHLLLSLRRHAGFACAHIRKQPNDVRRIQKISPEGVSERGTRQLAAARSNMGCRRRTHTQCFESQTNIGQIGAQLCSCLGRRRCRSSFIAHVPFAGVELLFSAID